MGAAMCNQCTTCSEFCADKFGSHDYLQDYQKRMLRAKDLDRYDLSIEWLEYRSSNWTLMIFSKN